MGGGSGQGVLRGNLELMVLSVLADQDQYGYRLQQQLRLASGGVADVKAGTLYPLLHRLEAEKWIRARWDRSTGRRRKWYALTASGRRRLDSEARAWERQTECMRRLLDPVLRGAPQSA